MAISPTTSAAASPATSFNVDGVISGLNTTSLITALMSQSQAPLNQLNAQQTKVKARDSAYQAISSQMITFQGSAQNLLLSTAINSKLSSSTVPTTATATADSSAINGTFSITVNKLATATAVTSSGGPNSGRLGTQATLDPSSGSTAFLTGTGAGGVNMSTPPTAGTFTVNGQKVTLAVGDNWAALQSKISALTGPAVTLNVVPGSNSVSLTSASPLQLGSPTDTSNFLSAAQLLSAAQTGSSGAGYTVASNQLLGGAQPNNTLAAAGLSVAGGIASGGSFAINGVSINWANTDSINNILTRINSSAAGVTATYDPKLDKVSLTNSATGAQSISLVDNTGNLLQAFNLTGAPQKAGAAAEYTTLQNGVISPTQFSNSNIVTGAVQGVSVTMLATGTTSITTTQDTATATKNVQAFITQFNSMVDALDAATVTSTTGGSGPLAGDSAITGLANQLRAIVSQSAIVPAGSAYATMGDVGISTGAYGSAIGTTNHLVLDTTKLTSALQTNPQAVMQLLSGLSGNTALAGDASSTALLRSATGSPYGQVNSGSYKVTFDPSKLTLTSVFTSKSGTISPAVVSGITAGGTNNSLIPGVSIVAQLPLPTTSTTATIAYTVSGRGILQTLNDYVNQSRGPSGVFTAESRDATSAEKDLTAQIATQNVILAARKKSLQAEFTAMEVALAKLQSQSASLASSLGVATTTAAANSASGSTSSTSA